MKKQMSKADKSGASLAVVIGPDEILRDAAVIKDLKSGSQKEHPLSEFEPAIEEALKSR